jgi:hypothetical protein
LDEFTEGTGEVRVKPSWQQVATFQSSEFEFTVPVDTFAATDLVVVQWQVDHPTQWLCNHLGVRGTLTASDPQGRIWIGVARWRTSDPNDGCDVALR